MRRPGRVPLGPGFRRLFASSAGSNLADGVLQAALPLLAATLTRDPVAVAAVSSLAFVPWLLFSLTAGALVDRVDRRRAMAVANGARALGAGLLAATVVTDVAAMPLLYAAALALGTAETVYDNAARALLPAVVRRDQLERGNSLLGTAESVGNVFLGAPLGAALFGLGVSLPLWLGSATYLLAAVLVLGVVARALPARPAATTIRADVAQGLRWLMGHPLLRPLMFASGLHAALHALTQGVLVLYVLEVLGAGERGFGLLLAAGGVGAVVGALVSPYVTVTLGRPHAMGLCGVVSGAAVLAMGTTDLPVLGAAAFAVSAAAVSAFNVQVMSVRQALVPEELFGRVQGAYRTVLWGGIPVGTLAGGALARVAGVPAVFVVSGAAGVVVSLGIWWLLHHHRAVVAAGFALP